MDLTPADILLRSIQLVMHLSIIVMCWYATGYWRRMRALQEEKLGSAAWQVESQQRARDIYAAAKGDVLWSRYLDDENDYFIAELVRLQDRDEKRKRDGEVGEYVRGILKKYGEARES